jgi:hypothetical protein
VRIDDDEVGALGGRGARRDGENGTQDHGPGLEVAHGPKLLRPAPGAVKLVFVAKLKTGRDEN